MNTDIKEQLMACVLAYLKAKEAKGLDDRNTILGISAGIDYYLNLLIRCNLVTLKEEINDRHNKVWAKCYEAGGDMRTLLEGESLFYHWLLKE